MGRSVRALLTTLAVALGVGSATRADLVVTVGNATISQGGTGSVDVLIRSTNPSGDPLSSFGFEFQILPTGPRHLDFRNPQLDGELALPSYVFAGNSGDVVDGVPVGVVHSVSGGTNNQFVGGDETDSGGNVQVTGNQLLVRLDLTAATSSAPVGGDTFTIALQPSAFTGFLDAANHPIPFTSTAGVITITASVPEPGSLALLATGASLALLSSAAPRRGPTRGGPPR
jgi:hypothetical protein